MGILDGRSAIIIGASSGVGYGAALRFAQEGANVVVGARRLAKLEKLRDEAKERDFSGEIVPVTCDVENDEDLDNIVKTCADRFGKVEILACIAQGALDRQKSFEESDADNILAFYTGGPLYTFKTIKNCLPYFKEQHYGRILTCTSGAGLEYTPHTCGYGMAKAAIVNLTKTCAQELGKYGVTTNSFAPVVTNDYFENDSSDASYSVDFMNMVSPVGYMGKAYEDCSPMLAFLVSEQASYINGQIISIDGNMGDFSAGTLAEIFQNMQGGQGQ